MNVCLCVPSASLLASLSLDEETVESLMFQRNVYKEAEIGIMPDNTNPDTIIELIRSVAVPAAVTAMINVARCVLTGMAFSTIHECRCSWRCSSLYSPFPCLHGECLYRVKSNTLMCMHLRLSPSYAAYHAAFRDLNSLSCSMHNVAGTFRNARLRMLLCWSILGWWTRL